MPNTNLLCTAHPALLLMAPELLSPELVAQLGRFCVTRADNARDIYLMRNVFQFSVAVFTDTVGNFALRASAQSVRSQWPKARIVILGKAPTELEDHLYDETVLHASSVNTLSEILDKGPDGSANQEDDALDLWLEHMSVVARLQQRRTIQESDPSKLPGLLMRAHHKRDWPASEQWPRRIH